MPGVYAAYVSVQLIACCRGVNRRRRFRRCGRSAHEGNYFLCRKHSRKHRQRAAERVQTNAAARLVGDGWRRIRRCAFAATASPDPLVPGRRCCTVEKRTFATGSPLAPATATLRGIGVQSVVGEQDAGSVTLPVPRGSARHIDAASAAACRVASPPQSRRELVGVCARSTFHAIFTTPRTILVRSATNRVQCRGGRGRSGGKADMYRAHRLGVILDRPVATDAGKSSRRKTYGLSRGEVHEEADVGSSDGRFWSRGHR